MNSLAKSNAIVIYGVQWGDEGKGKLTQYLLEQRSKLGPVVCVRANGGCNAGHSVYRKNESGEVILYDTHLFPTGVLTEGCMNVIGNGVVFSFFAFLKEYQAFRKKGIDVKDHIMISDKAVVTLKIHEFLDRMDKG